MYNIFEISQGENYLFLVTNKEQMTVCFTYNEYHTILVLLQCESTSYSW